MFADVDRSARWSSPPRAATPPPTAEFVADLAAHGGRAEQVTEVCQDMSEAFLTGALEHLPDGRDHLRPLPRQGAADQGRRRGPPRRARRARRPAQAQPLPVAAPASQPHRPPARTARRAAAPAPEDRPRLPLDAELRRRLRPPRRRGRALPAGMVRGAKRSACTRSSTSPTWSRSTGSASPAGSTRRITNGLLEGLNSLVQAAKRRARGYRSTRNYIAMIYLTVGRLDIHVTHAK